MGTLRRMLLGLVFVLFLAACGGAPAAAPTAATEPTAAPAETAMAEETAAPAETAMAEETAAPAETAMAEETAAPAASGETFSVAIVMPSSITDLAWSQSMYDGLLAIQAEMGGESAMTIAYSENMFNVTDAAAALRDYASQGTDLVIAHGTQYGTSLFELAPEFPETAFAWGTATDTGASVGLTNVFAYNARAEQGGYINGVLAAALSKAGKIGVIGPVEAGDAKAYIDGFEKGALATNPSATVTKIYTGSFGDTAKAAEAATTEISAGADVLTGSAQQVVGAIGVAKESGIPWFGTQSDQSSLAPELVVATQVYDWTGVLKDMISKIQSGTYGGTAYDLTLENGGLKMAFNEGYPLTAEAKAAAEAAIAAVSSGTITLTP